MAAVKFRVDILAKQKFQCVMRLELFITNAIYKLNGLNITL